MSGHIQLARAAVADGVQAIRHATDDFDTAVSRANPDASGTGLAAPLLQSVLSTVSEVGLRLVFELDTLAGAAEASAADMAAYEASAKAALAALGDSPR